MQALTKPILCHPQAAPIKEARLALERIDQTIHCLSIAFFSSNKEDALETVKFYIRPVSRVSGSHLTALAREILSSEEHGVADVFPLNGTVKNRNFKITDFLKESHRAEIVRHIDILNRCDSECRYARCLVTDFKDTKGRYENCLEISNTEKTFADFFRRAPSTNAKVQVEIQRLFKDNRINFFIHEGSLKADLIRKAFNSRQSSFFQGTSEGSEVLCQLCEVLMNGFKQGCETTVKEEVQFLPNDYLEALQIPPGCVGKEIPRFPSAKLITFYPSHYVDVYSDRSKYFQLITKTFFANHYYERETTIITIC